MKLLKDIPSRHFVSIDIETVRIKENYDDLSPEWKAAWEHKKKQAGEVPHFEELNDTWVKTASLYAEFSKICAVSITFLSSTGNKLMCKEFYGPNEVEILSGLKEYLERMEKSPEGKNYRLVGHAAKYFDYPFLCKRYIINGEEIPNILDTAHLKPWESRNLCTNADVWRMGGSGAGSSLQAMCTALGVPTSKVDLVGDEVGAAFFKKEYARIGRYCSYDTIATFNVIRKIKREELFSFEEVVYLKEAKKETPEEKPPVKKAVAVKKVVAVKKQKKSVSVKKDIEEEEEDLFTVAYILDRINNNPQITEEERLEVFALLKRNPILEEDREVLKDIISKLYINSAMFVGDKADVVARKEAEVEAILDSLQ